MPTKAMGRTFSFIALILLVALSSRATEPNLVGGLTELYPWPAENFNLVQNPSFEDVSQTGAVSRWKIGSPEHFFSSLQDARTGRRSLNLKDSHLSQYYPSALQTLSLEPGWYSLMGWLKAENAGSNARGAGARISLNWGSERVAGPVVRGTTEWTKVEVKSFPIMPGESAQVRLEAYGKPDGNIFFDDIAVYQLASPTVEGFLLYPNYRGILFDDRTQLIRLSVRLEKAQMILPELRIRLILETDTGTAVSKKELTPTETNFTITLDATKAPSGSLRLRLIALTGSGAELFEYPIYRIVKMPSTWRAGRSAYVDFDNITVLNGQRKFVLGIYDTSGYFGYPAGYDGRIGKIAEAPLDIYLNYFFPRAPIGALNALMTTLEKHGMSYLHTSNAWYSNDGNWPYLPSCNGAKANELGQGNFTGCMARAAGANPGLAGWYTADERPVSQVERVFNQYKILRENDPDGVTFIAQNKIRELVRWRDAADVIGVDPYPIYNIPEGQIAPLHMVTEWVEAAQKAVERSRPVWAVIQYFQFGSKGHWPTYDELRTMSYMAIVAGAKGLFYWSYGAKGLSWVKDPVRKEELWQRLVRVTKEIKSLEPALLSPDAPHILQSMRLTPMTETTVADDAIRVLAKEVGRTRYIFAVNNTPNEVRADFTLSDRAKSVEVIGEGNSLQLSQSRQYQDIFAPYATHVYKISQ